ncbi:MAG: hypothetical protein H3C38_06660 [Rhodospirillales bacterium]|nr:hypothetical protein [Rhodospirillales bacterium]
MPVEVPGHAAKLGLEVPRRNGEPCRRRDHDDLAAAGPRIVADYRHRTGALDDHHAAASAATSGAGLIGSRDRQENDKEEYAQHLPAVNVQSMARWHRNRNQPIHDIGELIRWSRGGYDLVEPPYQRIME